MCSMRYKELVEKYLLDDEESAVPQAKTFEKAHLENDTEAELSNIEKIENSIESEDYQEVENGLEMLRGVEDTFWLEYFAATSENKQAREIATQLLDRQEKSLRAITIASEFADTRNDALVRLGSMLDQINDPATKALVAKNHPQKEKRLSAIKTINESSIISEIARSSKYEDSRWSSLLKLKSQGGVIDNLLERKYSLINLFDAVLENENTKSTELIVENLDAVREVLKGKNEQEISQSASKAAGFYKEVLACIACRSKNPKSRQSALESLNNDYKKLSMVASNSSYRDSTDVAIGKLGSMLDQISDSETLALVANHHQDEQIRRDAISKISDAEVLRKIAKFSRKPEIKNIAIAKISHLSDDESATIIDRIAKEKRSGIKQKAKKKKIVIQQDHVRLDKEPVVRETPRINQKIEVNVEPEIEKEETKGSGGGFSSIIRTIRDLLGF